VPNSPKSSIGLAKGKFGELLSLMTKLKFYFRPSMPFSLFFQIMSSKQMGKKNRVFGLEVMYLRIKPFET